MPALAPLIVAICSILGIQVSEDAAALMADNLSATLGAFAALILVVAKAIDAWRSRK